MEKITKEIATKLKGVELIGLQFKAPTTLETALTVLSDVSSIIDFYLNRSSQYHLFCLVAKNPSSYWQSITACVTDKDGTPLPSNTEDCLKQLGLNGVLEAVGVFCDGLENLQVTDIYARFAGGFDGEDFALNLLADQKRYAEVALDFDADPTKSLANLIDSFIVGAGKKARG